jgi:hypothetical protein
MVTSEKLSDSMRQLTKTKTKTREKERSAIDSFLMTSGTFKTFELTDETNPFPFSHQDSSLSTFPFPTSTPAHTATHTPSSTTMTATTVSKKPPLHQKQQQALSLLDEIESSESEPEEDLHSRGHHGQGHGGNSQSKNTTAQQQPPTAPPVSAPVRKSYSDSSSASEDNDDDDSEGGMIFPSQPSSIGIHGSRERERFLPSQNGASTEEDHQDGTTEESPMDSFPESGRKGGAAPAGASDIDQRINALQKFLQKARFVHSSSMCPPPPLS